MIWILNGRQLLPIMTVNLHEHASSPSEPPRMPPPSSPSTSTADRVPLAFQGQNDAWGPTLSGAVSKTDVLLLLLPPRFLLPLLPALLVLLLPTLACGTVPSTPSPPLASVTAVPASEVMGKRHTALKQDCSRPECGKALCSTCLHRMPARCSANPRQLMCLQKHVFVPCFQIF